MTWECDACTLHNDVDSKICAACERMRPKRTSSWSSHGDEREGVDSEAPTHDNSTQDEDLEMPASQNLGVTDVREAYEEPIDEGWVDVPAVPTGEAVPVAEAQQEVEPQLTWADFHAGQTVQYHTKNGSEWGAWVKVIVLRSISDGGVGPGSVEIKYGESGARLTEPSRLRIYSPAKSSSKSKSRSKGKSM